MAVLRASQQRGKTISGRGARLGSREEEQGINSKLNFCTKFFF